MAKGGKGIFFTNAEHVYDDHAELRLNVSPPFHPSQILRL